MKLLLRRLKPFFAPSVLGQFFFLESDEEHIL